jgi:hypothetical protein
MIDVYYKPSDIHFSREQMFWLISVLPCLEEGSWPLNPCITGYTEAENTGRVNTSSRAPFETAIQIYTEVTYRLALTGKDGQTLYWEIQQGKVEEYQFLCPAAKQAINYMSGWRRRKWPYRKWCYEQSHKTDNCPKPNSSAEARA